MIRVFAGFDPREAIGFAVFCDSLIRHASQPVAITPLASQGLPQGSNTFTLSRFLIPFLCGYKGHAIFLDGSDMLMQADIAELDALFDPSYAVQVVKHPEYTTRHPRKYVGTAMECDNRDYERKNWMSAAIINCGHAAWGGCEPRLLRKLEAIHLLQLRFLDDSEIGDLPPRWNVLADEGQDVEDANVLHWTAGIPSFYHYRNAIGSEIWHRARARMEIGQ